MHVGVLGDPDLLPLGGDADHLFDLVADVQPVQQESRTGMALCRQASVGQCVRYARVLIAF